jgi:uncharacterized protein YjbI with pentapeptide repeats
LSNSRLYNTDVDGAVLANIDLSGADVFNTAISVGGEY